MGGLELTERWSQLGWTGGAPTSACELCIVSRGAACVLPRHCRIGSCKRVSSRITAVYMWDVVSGFVGGWEGFRGEEYPHSRFRDHCVINIHIVGPAATGFSQKIDSPRKNRQAGAGCRRRASPRSNFARCGVTFGLKNCWLILYSRLFDCSFQTRGMHVILYSVLF